ncbi:anthranilate synthase / indole-3-glycerol phosphate synthase [Aspergillus melleus]|uniref:Anthranilate synthase / indole-3-glycerol phosphate synthase n=1 Tax=Aspergillus melleus TaxID=138277 RepID=A0ACC3BBG2_9EURO|nr:anthranilate synthase / indole-3-glycerol phosphate synthase [Aspergillus melleus]
MEHIRQAFARAASQQRAALVAYITAGYPTIEETVELLLGLETGGADVIELGVPFTDPIADGPVIEAANVKALANGVTIATVLNMVREARRKGVRVPILLMGYYNPILQYGEERMVGDCKDAGVNGFVMTDLPPEEAGSFRGLCNTFGLSFIPLVAPATPNMRIKLLCQMADSFIYVVSRMGVTGATDRLGEDIGELMGRVRTWSGRTPTAVGFGVSTREHFLAVQDIAQGCVIGSQILKVIGAAPAGQAATRVVEYLAGVTGRRLARGANGVLIDYQSATQPVFSDQRNVLDLDSRVPPSIRFGEFGGQYVPEALINCLVQLERGFEAARQDPTFWDEYRAHYAYLGRPSSLHLAARLTEHVGGANIWLKREDLNHTGSHKVNNALGQILLARRLGKTRIIAETGAGQHGVATATLCAKFGLQCVIYMGEEDTRRQALNVFRMKLLGAEVVPVQTGGQTLRDAVSAALRAWVSTLDTTHYVLGSVSGPHPFPTIVRTFQSVIGDETKQQMNEAIGRLPDAVVACVGGGSNASGMFYPFLHGPVQLLGVEAGGDGLDTSRHSATITRGSKGVLHGVYTYLLQDTQGQVSTTHSISAGMDYPGVGPELSAWKDSQRARFMAATDAQALSGFRALAEYEGILPALESSHAVYGAMELARTMERGQNIVVSLSGRGDKDVQSVADHLPRLGPEIGWDLVF